MTDHPIKDYILAAEADKIQDLIFRSAYLREVVGGSQLLTQFCKEIPIKIAPEVVSDDDIITSDGGSFRIQFDHEDDAKRFGDKLAELYRHATGGSLTVTEPIKTNKNFKVASDAAMLALRQAKQDHQDRISVEQMPYMALCASCGVGLAKKHRPLDLNPELDLESQFLCESCIGKAEERTNNRFGSFLGPFAQDVAGDSYQDFKWAKRPEDVACFDRRNYVAYIVADGNNMGKVFSACTDIDIMKNLSESLSKVLSESLATATKDLMKRTGEIKNGKFQYLIPTLPLILAGDDLFALIPAPWALDFAQKLVQSYEEKVLSIVQKVNHNEKQPTMGVAVVICKASYPYYLAHRRGEELLSQAKQMGKRWGIENKANSRSAITFEVVLGNRIAGAEKSDTQNRPTLKPYWAEGIDTPGGWGIPLQTILDQRFKLADLGVSQKRLIQLRELFDRLPASRSGEKGQKAFDRWQSDCNQLLQRVKQRSSKQGEALQAAVDVLGGRDLYHFQRATDEDAWFGHGLPDLVTAWEYAFDLSKSMTDYEGGE